VAWQVEWLIPLKKMIVKMLMHLHMVVYTGGVSTFAKEVLFERWRSVESPSPSYRACEAGFGEETEAKRGHR
jgi:hypothetical protein